MRHHRTARTELTAPHAVIYLRVSTDDQARGISLSVQDRDCRAWCVTAGVSVAAVFVEPESAKTDARAEFQKAVAFARASKGRVTHFVIWKLDRFSRVALDTLAYRAAIATAGARLVSVLEPAVGSDPVGKFVTTMLSGMNEYANDEKAERVIACMSKLLEDGYWTHSAPLGYVLARDGDRPTLAQDPVAGPILAKVLSMIARREARPMQALKIAGELGLRTRTGRLVSPSSWYDLLASPVYCGLIKTSMTGGKTYRGRWTPIVAPETWSDVQNVVRGERTGRIDRRARQEWPFRGFLRCPCGSLMTADASNLIALYRRLVEIAA